MFERYWAIRAARSESAEQTREVNRQAAQLASDDIANGDATESDRESLTKAYARWLRSLVS